MFFRTLLISCLFFNFIFLYESKKVMSTVESSRLYEEKRGFIIGDLSYHRNGVVAKNATIVPIVWNNGGSLDGLVKNCLSQVPDFFKALLKTKAMTKYVPGVRNTEPQGKLFGVDNNIHFLTPVKKISTLNDKDIIDELIGWITKKYDVKAPNSTIPSNTKQPLDYVYMIFFPRNTVLKSGSCKKYCAFHSSFTYSRVKYAYAAIPWPGDCPKSCTLPIYNTNSSGLIGDDSVVCGALNSIAFHELTEILTNPYSNAYYDGYGLENGDKCIWKSPPACFTSSNKVNYCIQPIWNHEAKNSKNPSSGDTGCVSDY